MEELKQTFCFDILVAIASHYKVFEIHYKVNSLVAVIKNDIDNEFYDIEIKKRGA